MSERPGSEEKLFYCPVRGCKGHAESWHLCPTFCTWTCSALNTWTWQTDCGKTFWLEDEATPSDIGMRFCGFCGRNLEQRI